ncbi:MAG: YcxB family protein [Bacillota bacterium]|nr:YcxB family protein [Bacillota bacterium]
MEKTDIEVTVELNANDRIKAMLYNIFFRRKWVTVYVGIFIIFSLLVLGAWAFNIYNVPMPLVLCAGGLILLLVLFVVSIVMSSQGSVSKRRLRFTDTGFTTSVGRDNKTLSFRWKDMFFTGSTGNYFYIYIDASQFIIVPKRYLSAEEIKSLKELI